jgi:hypothetical protein
MALLRLDIEEAYASVARVWLDGTARAFRLQHLEPALDAIEAHDRARRELEAAIEDAERSVS